MAIPRIIIKSLRTILLKLQMTETMVGDNKDVNWNNLSENERNALKQFSLKKSIVIKVADKGGAIVAMNQKDYVDSIKRDLSNKKHHHKLEKDNVDEINGEIQKIIEQIKDYLNDLEYKVLTDDNETSTPVFYGLPKIHKEYELFPPLRPIVAGYNSVKLSEYVDSYLKPAAQKSWSFVRDTTHFLNKLKKKH